MMDRISINAENFLEYSSELFNILADNMTKIAPTGSNREEDYEFWVNILHKRLLNKECYIIAFTHFGNIIAYFQFSNRQSTFLIEEIQIKPTFQVQYNIVGKIIKLLPTIVQSNTLYIEAYANKNNNVSRWNLSKAGFEIIGENKNGKSYLYRGDYSTLASRFKIN